jgi:hypothetical protein
MKSLIAGVSILLAAGSACASTSSSPAAYETVLQKVYIGYFGRPADPAGLAYFAGAYAQANAPTSIDGVANAYGSNPTLRALLDSFSTSKESQELYPGDNSVFIEAVYQNLFNRAADAAGKDYWAKLIDSGAITRSNAALSIMAGARGSDAVLIDTKTAAATAFTKTVDTASLRSGYSGMAANAVVRTMFSSVNSAMDANAVQEKILATLPLLFGSYSVPTDLAQITYPASFSVRTPANAAATNLCDLDTKDVRYPDYYLGNYPLPPVTGAPLATSIQRGVNMKDVWDTANPSFASGCSGDIRSEMTRTISRLKSLGADYVSVTPWTFFRIANTGWTILNPADLHTSTMDDSDLTW